MTAQCYYCGVTLTRRGHHKITWDHRVPKSKGGNGKENLVPACFVCNQDKGIMTEDEFMFVLEKRVRTMVNHVHVKMMHEAKRTQKPVPVTKELTLEDYGLLYELGIKY